VTIEDLSNDHLDAAARFFGRLPEADLTFVKEDVHDPAAIESWIGQNGARWVAVDGDTVVGFAALRPLPGYSDHVAELRLVVDPSRRGHGLGRKLTLQAVGWGLRHAITKVVVEVAAEQEHTIDMFGKLGFTGEALLRDHVRDRTGEVHDLVLLALFTDVAFGAMDAVGLADALDADGF
jgi:RimJ/RimL family protein N-acetyltransferase